MFKLGLISITAIVIASVTFALSNPTIIDEDLPLPIRDDNPHGVEPTLCRSESANAFLRCYLQKNIEEKSFRIDRDTKRDFEFKYTGLARQDMHLFIMDAQDGRDTPLSQFQNRVIFFFPRKFLPTVKAEGELIHVTLPTGESVQYDRNTKRIVGGALKETGEPKSGQAPQVEYTGSGVTITAVARAGEPRQKAKTAIISKPGKKPCVVPSNKLWPDKRDSSALNFQFKTDAEFDQFLRSACKFGLG